MRKFWIIWNVRNQYEHKKDAKSQANKPGNNMDSTRQMNMGSNQKYSHMEGRNNVSNNKEGYEYREEWEVTFNFEERKLKWVL